MKKIMLLFTLLCAGALIGMEQPSYETLPKEIKQTIIDKALAASNYLSEAIWAIKNLSILHKVRYDSPKDTVALVKALAKKFPDESEEEIALKLETYGLIELRSEWKTLPSDIKSLILVAFVQSGNNIFEAVQNIRVASLTNTALNQMINKQYDPYNLKGFTALVGMLADKFQPIYKSTENIAQLFDTPTAKQYIALGEEFKTTVLDEQLMSDMPEVALQNAKILIQKGVDPNYSWGFSSILKELCTAIITITPFLEEANQNLIEILTLLLDNGARPHLSGWSDYMGEEWSAGYALHNLIEHYYEEDYAKQYPEEYSK